jgi:phosphoribosylformimino-5-aminoimidazole carboxamide ribonucleotide (ProFAR) isomerase
MAMNVESLRIGGPSLVVFESSAIADAARPSDRKWRRRSRGDHAIVRGVSFIVLPAIDVWEGHLALATDDGPVAHPAFGGDPLVAADANVRAGARWVHVVDLDLAFRGQPANVDVVRAIANDHPNTRVQVSGGIVTTHDRERYVDAGAARVVLGSAALDDREALAGAIAEARDSVLVGLEVDEGVIRARGASSVELDLAETLQWLVSLPAPGFLVTAVSKVARLSGPDATLVRQVARTGVPTIAAGGIRSLADLGALRTAGAVGAVVGRAALDGALPIGDALAWAGA